MLQVASCPDYSLLFGLVADNNQVFWKTERLSQRGAKADKPLVALVVLI